MARKMKPGPQAQARAAAEPKPKPLEKGRTVFVVVNTNTGQAEPIRQAPIGYTNDTATHLLPMMASRQLVAWDIYRVERPKGGLGKDPTVVAKQTMEKGTKVYEFKDGQGSWLEACK